MEKTKDISLDELINGGTRYRTILQILRESLAIELKNKLKDEYGAIAFFKYDPESQIKMNFFPLFPGVIDKNFPADEVIRLEYLKMINADRPISQIYYVDHFRSTYKTTKHTKFEVAKDADLLRHTQDAIDGLSWTDFIKQKDLNINRLDFLFFEERQKSYRLFPLPVLCSPCILLFLPYNDNLSIDELAPIVRDAINNYVLNRLMTGIRSDLAPAVVSDRTDLIQRFIDEFNEAALPIAYKYKGETHPFIDWYGKFKHNGENVDCGIDEDAGELELDLDGEIVTFFLPSFCWNAGNLLHKEDHYQVKRKQMEDTIQNVFQLVYSNWLAINSERAYLEADVTRIIKETRASLAGVQRLNDNVNSLESILTKIASNKGVETDNEFYFKDEIVNGKRSRLWKLRFNGQTYIDGKSSQGLAILHHLMCKYYIDENATSTNDELNAISKEAKANTVITTNATKQAASVTAISGKKSIGDEVREQFNEYSGYNNDRPVIRSTPQLLDPTEYNRKSTAVAKNSANRRRRGNIISW